MLCVAMSTFSCIYPQNLVNLMEMEPCQQVDIVMLVEEEYIKYIKFGSVSASMTIGQLTKEVIERQFMGVPCYLTFVKRDLSNDMALGSMKYKQPLKFTALEDPNKEKELKERLLRGTYCKLE